MKKYLIAASFLLFIYIQCAHASEEALCKSFAALSLKSFALPAFYTEENGWCRIHFTNSTAVLGMSKKAFKNDPRYMNLPYGSQSPK